MTSECQVEESWGPSQSKQFFPPSYDESIKPQIAESNRTLQQCCPNSSTRVERCRCARLRPAPSCDPSLMRARQQVYSVYLSEPTDRGRSDERRQPRTNCPGGNWS